jgi:hypothetical protein
MMKAITRVFASLLVSLVLFGCAGQQIKIASVTDQTQIDKTQGRKISASASGFQLLLLIPIAINGRHESAYRDLLAQAGDGVLADVTVTESWSYAFVGTVYKTTMEATVYPKLKALVK